MSVVSKWIVDAVGGLWKDVNAAFTAAGKALSGAVSGLWKDVNAAFTAAGKALSGAFDSLWVNIVAGVSSLWDSISSSISGLWDSVSTAFSDLWTSVSGAVDGLWVNIVKGVSGLWDSISAGLNGLWTSVSGAVDSAVTSIGSGLSSLWTGIVDTVGNLWNSVSTGLAAVGNAIGGAVNTIGSWVSDAIKGVVTAMGTALRGFVGWFASNLSDLASMLANGLKAIMDTVGAIISPIITGFVATLQAAFTKGSPDKKLEEAVTKMMDVTRTRILDEIKQTHKSPWTPEAVLRADQLIAGTVLVAQLAVHSAAAAAGIEIMGTRIDLTDVVEKAVDTLGLNKIVGASFALPIAIGLLQPLKYAYNDMFRPRIPDTRTADQMLFEENIAEPEWRQIYRYQGWRESDIDAWFKTMWREPSLLVLRNLVLDPDVDEAWVRKKMREGGLIGEDADAIIAYGKRQSLKDERSALASQVQTDLIDGVIIEADARADLQALKFTPGEIDYRIARCTLIVARNERRAALKAIKNFTEADLKQEVALGLRTRDQFVADMATIGFAAAIAQRKYVLITTSKPLSAAEVETRRTVVQSKIVKATRRFDMLIARHDLQTGLIADMIDYLSGLEKPPDVRIASLMLQLNKAADEKALILEERDAELADLQAELSLTQAG